MTRHDELRRILTMMIDNARTRHRCCLFCPAIFIPFVASLLCLTLTISLFMFDTLNNNKVPTSSFIRSFIYSIVLDLPITTITISIHHLFTSLLESLSSIVLHSALFYPVFPSPATSLFRTNPDPRAFPFRFSVGRL